METRAIILMSASYVLGAVPTGYIVGRFKNIDIRKYGSGNPGTANVYRTLGKWPGIVTFAIDFLKGLLPALTAARLYPGHYGTIIACGGLAIAGHIWTIFLKFKGGKGVATSAGVFMALLPLATAGAFVTFALAVALTRHISIGSMAASVILPALCFIFKCPWPLTAMALSVCGLIFYTHIPNIRRILAGRELAFDKNPARNEKRQ
jgi:acyl phosphate:glycerol-3-phosphate acyltransferase